MNWLKRIQILVLVVLVFFGTTGVTVYHHICACTSQNIPVLESCCAPAVTPTCCETTSLEIPPSPETAHKGCGHDHNGCKDIPLYFKASLIGLPVAQKVTFQVHVPEFDVPFASIFHAPEQDEIKSVKVARPDPPPCPSGRSLVYSLHQPKIPCLS